MTRTQPRRLRVAKNQAPEGEWGDGLNPSSAPNRPARKYKRRIESDGKVARFWILPTAAKTTSAVASLAVEIRVVRRDNVLSVVAKRKSLAAMRLRGHT